jgi:hypothetical protein
MASELLRHALVHAVLRERRDEGVPHVVDALVRNPLRADGVPQRAVS